MSSLTSTSSTSGNWAVIHAALRDALLQRVVSTLGADERFVAAWFTGSFGRGEQDAYSDVDLVAVVAPPYADSLCDRPWPGAARTTPERLALIQRLGSPVIVHDAHRNAPEGGTHTNVAFDDGTHLDLNLVPLGRALRPADAPLLFEKQPVPVAPAPEVETLEYRREKAAQIVALFWIMAASTAKYRRRGWDVNVHMMFDALRRHIEEVRRLIAGEPAQFRRYAPSIPLATTQQAQADALRTLCDEMDALAPHLARFGAQPVTPARAQVERWLTGP